MKRRLGGWLLILLFSTAATAITAAPLSHNPFRWPDLGRLPAGDAARTANLGGNELPTVRAVMSAGDFTAANINGTLVLEGEFYQGYQLLEVHEGRVVLQKSGQRYTVPVYGDEHSDSEHALH